MGGGGKEARIEHTYSKIVVGILIEVDVSAKVFLPSCDFSCALIDQLHAIEIQHQLIRLDYPLGCIKGLSYQFCWIEKKC